MDQGVKKSFSGIEYRNPDGINLIIHSSKDN